MIAAGVGGSARGRAGDGAAAVAMLLEYWSLPIAAEDIRRELHSEPAHGVSTSDLRDFVRESGLPAFVLQGTFQDIERELEQGRPVLVGLAPDSTGGADERFELVVGLDLENRRVLSVDPMNGQRVRTFEAFAREWLMARCLALVVLGPKRNSRPS